MATSRRKPLLLVSIAALGAAVAACDSILGLGNYHDVACDPITGMGTCDAGGIFDAPPPPDSTLLDVFDAGGDDATDSGVAVDAAREAMPPSDAPYDAPSVTALWARWPMPNPDAATFPGASTLLPNPMAYDAGADGGDGTVLDLVTNLRWFLTPQTPPSGPFDPAVAGCPAGFQVPTRIQLVTLIDFTRGNPTIDTSIFTQVMGDRYWTSSSVPAGGSAPYWTVDFSNGLVSNADTGSRVLCVKEGP